MTKMKWVLICYFLRPWAVQDEVWLLWVAQEEGGLGVGAGAIAVSSGLDDEFFQSGCRHVE